MCDKCDKTFERITAAIETADYVRHPNHHHDDIVLFNSILDMMGLHEMIGNVEYTVIIVPSENLESLVVEPKSQKAYEAMKQYGFPQQVDTALVFTDYKAMAQELGCL